jgi:periplasmic copper chaperone A
MRILLMIVALLITTSAFAEVTISDVWVRTTAPGQKVAGAYLQIISSEDAKITGGASPISEALELHEMSMKGDVMKMRSLDSIELPAGKQISLKPGGLHIMLMGIKSQIKDGDTVPIELIITAKDGKHKALPLMAQAKASY